MLGTLQRSELRDSVMETARANVGGLFSPLLTDAERALGSGIVAPLLVPNSTYSDTLTAAAGSNPSSAKRRRRLPNSPAVPTQPKTLPRKADRWA